MGKGGIRNYDTQHFDSKQCKKDQKKHQNTKNDSKTQARFLSFFGKKSTATVTPSTVKAPPLVIASASSSTTLPPSQSENIIKSKSSTPSVEQQPARSGPAPCPLAIRILTACKQAADRLPSTVPEGKDSDVLAQFAVEPPRTTVTDAWEVLDPLLNNAIGWGATAEDVRPLIRRGANGVHALCRFVEYFVMEYGIEGALLEGKLNTLREAMELV